MPRLRLLHRRSGACPLLWASLIFAVQHGYACSWRAALFDYTTQETTSISIDDTPVKMPLGQAAKGVEVHCSLAPSDVISLGMLKQQKVDIVCRYPDDQMLTARAITIFDIFTGETLTHPVILFFSNARKYNETLYRLSVDCQ